MATTGSAGAGTAATGSRGAARAAAAGGATGIAGGGTGDASLLELLGADAESFQSALAAITAGGGDAASGSLVATDPQAAATPRPAATARARDGASQEESTLPGADTLAALAAMLPWMNVATPAQPPQAPVPGATAQGAATSEASAAIGAADAPRPDSRAAALAQLLARRAQPDATPGDDAAATDITRQAATAAAAPATAGATTATTTVAADADRSAGGLLPTAPGGAGAPAALAQLASAIAPAFAADGGPGMGQGDSRGPATPGTQGQGGTGDVFAAIQGAAQAAQPAAQAPAPVARNIDVPVHDRQWPQAMAAQVQVLSEQRVQAATIRLSPEHLGPVEVRIDLNQSRVDVTFTAAHAETRAALEQTVPELRAVLMGSGLTLGQATVQQQMRQGSQSAPGQAPALPSVTRDAALEAAPVRALGLVDEYV